MLRLSLFLLTALLALTAWIQAPAAAPSATSTLSVISWNVESGGADAVTIAGQLAAFDGIDLWGLSEVNGDDDALLYETGAEVGEDAVFARVTGTTGGGDRLVALYDDDRFDLIASDELDEINVGGNVRAALVLTLTETATGLDFLFMVNHLYRTNDDARRTQATLLNEWAANQTLPVIATGDYNFDWDVQTEAHDLGYDLMTVGGVWEWIKPATLVTTQCSGDPCAFNSVLDFVFAAGAARDWQATSEIVVRAGDFPDGETTSDHRPVQAVFAATVEDQPSVANRVYLPSLNVAPGADPIDTPSPTTSPTQTPTATDVQAGPTATHTPTITPMATADQPSGPCPCAGNLYNCPDFATQPEAQACMEHCEALGFGDIHGLDGNDDDGLACESLPGGFAVLSYPLAATQNQTTTVTIFAYDDTNGNGWRDPDENPYLPPLTVGEVFCYDFRAAACDYETGVYTCLAEGYSNVRELPQACTFTVKRTTPGGFFDKDFGMLTTISDAMTIYFPHASSTAPDNLLGTATPTPTSIPSAKPTTRPTATATFTPTPTTSPMLDRIFMPALNN